MALEIERKFRVAAGWEVPGGARGDAIRQAYLSPAGAPTEFRVRQRGDTYLMTVKAGKRSSPAHVAVREEIEFEITEDVFLSLWNLAAGDCLSKTRWSIPWEGHEITVDVYDGVLEGVRVAEVEFDDLASAEDFRPPEWLGEEVTGQPEWGNRALARRSREHAERAR
ncbi:CYTH domain-containing protein [Nonomuraea helvata]|uniref:CYTH domain-containing protein n=1 Tax=Nonomuraea helvata TaxID=37484 RepID=A0ABV5SAG0_9ACTN